MHAVLPEPVDLLEPEILFALENEFEVSIPDEEVKTVRNVRQMCEGVEKLVAAKLASAGAQS